MASHGSGNLVTASVLNRARKQRAQSLLTCWQPWMLQPVTWTVSSASSSFSCLSIVHRDLLNSISSPTELLSYLVRSSANGVNTPAPLLGSHKFHSALAWKLTLSPSWNK